jgi:hypothetical protein
MAKKSKKFNLIKAIKRHSRQAQLDRDKAVGRAVPKTYGGKPNAKQERRNAKRAMKRLDNDLDSR